MELLLSIRERFWVVGSGRNCLCDLQGQLRPAHQGHHLGLEVHLFRFHQEVREGPAYQDGHLVHLCLYRQVALVVLVLRVVQGVLVPENESLIGHTSVRDALLPYRTYQLQMDYE